MPPDFISQRILPRLQRWRLVARLAREAGWRHLSGLALLSGLGSVLDIAGLGVGVSLLLGATPDTSWQLPVQLPLPQGLAVLVALMLLRGLLQALAAIGQERLRSGFTDGLRQQLFGQVLQASSTQLEQLGRGELLGLLMADISRSVLALDQGMRSLQALLSLGIYAAGVLVVGRQAAFPLVLALAATGGAALLQRSGSWQLGRLQSHLNGALQRTVGDGLHGLKAVRAAAAESWLLQRFAQDNDRFRRVLRQTVQRQALFTVWRDTLVVLVVGGWLIWGRAGLGPAAIATTLLLAYRSGTALSAVINAQRLCLGALPGYDELCKRRQLLRPAAPAQQARTAKSQTLAGLNDPQNWTALHWSPATAGKEAERVELKPGSLVAVAGPSGSGKTTLLDRVCGLLGEDSSQWQIASQTGAIALSGSAGARQLRGLLAYAPQEAVLFETSLRHNLLLDQEAPAGLIEEWLEKLGLSHLCHRGSGLDDPMPLALDHFSGGEIHRLGLLGAWLRNRPVEVLDEPTAFLDAESAQRVRAILAERARERLVLVSTHDPELIKQAGKVLRLQVSDRQQAERLHHG
ncbi:ABC transporter ATP-binding protein [Cyanobium sp. BA20m-p-22]|uniref:ABC transporter ATP-binding protein n=1 Tax=Cyanobium sp. BA20m-p-22 TaxID=2823704 RepID=UPI0020CD05BA|nr:ABC transporter ATP-binding protein [Cyanobium sp. BA20m-p-22]MCP9910272.1 ABC transporter ATP-binding protein [Cyanobium sp. BA20m-p-22]